LRHEFVSFRNLKSTSGDVSNDIPVCFEQWIKNRRGKEKLPKSKTKFGERGGIRIQKPRIYWGY